MLTFFRRHTLIAFTLLAMLSQGLLSNGSFMVGKAQAHEAMMSSSHHSQMMTMKNGATCHTEQQTSDTSPCCDSEQIDEVLPDETQSCCNGNGYCQGDCNHCLVISVTGTLFETTSWPGFSPSELAMATQMPHFHSISIAKDIKPPIA
ncbi:hypothetical protein FM038_001150 [Shewanella eurypsychrophilus]|uniref:Uncharacterized protein n=1 Tax=Shewanella eurypsychrophilus TaxID=2593656 RepID=A0ABX8S5K2_9GAMM|nr:MULTISPECIES: hypothetical protein [Shewanella]QFU20618.1 hypothetical protein FS418_01140 [Shewanella sp. YLB-09]QFU20899.1 hypothetical protein FS418_02750 [Shewanella sp. YLB-09]QXP44973.1 hypothetical protein FM038_001150 [Shewanella eurypsychrophilus]